MWGATGIAPWPHTWAEYKRLHTGWRRYRGEYTGAICATLANGLLPRKDRRAWRIDDFTRLHKPPPKWKAKLSSAADVLKELFCRPPPPPASGTSNSSPDKTLPRSP